MHGTIKILPSGFLPHMILPEIFALRHGQTEWNARGLLQGHLDSPLTATGIEQAKAQGRLLAALDLPSGICAISSPLGRAVQTAEIALAPLGMAFGTDENLAEQMMGDWQGISWAEIEHSWPNLYKAHQALFEVSFQAPGGESFVDVKQRVQRFINGLNTPAIIISHGVTLNVLRGLVCDLSFQDMSQLSHSHGDIFHLKDEKETRLSAK